jgi:tetratricopeptide (TPR) repeat protein
MNAARFDAVMAVFEAACELAGDARARLLEQACPDARFRAEVEALLRHHDAAHNAADAAVRGAQDAVLAVPDTALPASAAALPPRIGDYRPLRILGSGGMGVVYEAEQDHPARRVALKVIHGHGASPAMAQRFAREAELLARLQHPGIAQIFAAGTHAGVPFLAMELVVGEPLDIAARMLPWRQRIELLVKVCDAVQHAHSHGVVHRDLKPGNVLVDAAGEPKVLDFGIARALDDGADAHTLLTRTGQLLGTLEFMSPEQLAGNPLGIDAQSDVYALGMVLYVLLAGRLPFDVAGKPVADVILLLRDRELPRLSQLAPFLPDDVVTIVHTALAKDRARRYGTVALLAADLRRFLTDQPIAARPPSTLYVLGKFARRHRGLVTASCLVFGATLAGLIVSLRLYYLADERAKEAQRQAQIAHAVRGFLVEVFADANPSSNPRAHQMSLRELVATAAERATQRFAGERQLERSIRGALGETFVGLGAYDDAEREYQHALALAEQEQDAGTDTTLLRAGLASLHVARGRAQQGEALARTAIDLAPAQCDCGALAAAHKALGGALQAMYRWDEADAAFSRALELQAAATGSASALYARQLVSRAAVRLSLHRNVEAEQDLTAGIELLERWYGPMSSHTLIARHNLAGLFIANGDLARAERELRAVCAAEEAVFGADHPERSHSLSGLGVVLSKRGDYAGAEASLRDALRLAENADRNEGSTVELVLTNLAYVRGKRDAPKDAEQMYERAFALRKARGAKPSPDAVRGHVDLARIKAVLGDHDGEVAMLRRALEIAHSLGGAAGGLVASTSTELAQRLRALGREGEAVAVEAALREPKVPAAIESATVPKR